MRHVGVIESHRRHHRGPSPAQAALMTLGLGVTSAVGYVAVASSRTRRRIRAVEARYGATPPPLRLN